METEKLGCCANCGGIAQLWRVESVRLEDHFNFSARCTVCSMQTNEVLAHIDCTEKAVSMVVERWNARPVALKPEPLEYCN